MSFLIVLHAEIILYFVILILLNTLKYFLFIKIVSNISKVHSINEYVIITILQFHNYLFYCL